MSDHAEAIKISILINNYNYARFLAKAIDSAFQQTWPHVEIIVVDDGSTDHSDAIGNAYSGKNYKFFSKQNGGQNSAIAYGLPHLTGDYTLILDSDDWLRADACEVIAKIARTTMPNSIMYKLKKIDLDGNVVGQYPDAEFIETGMRDFVLKHGYISCSPTSGNVYKTDFLKKAFKFVSKDSLFSDGYLAAAAAYTEKVVCINDFLAFYLVHGSNVSLSAGFDDNKLIKNNNYALDHAKNLYAWLEDTKDKPQNWISLISEYSWKNILYFKLKRNDYREFSWSDCAYYGTRKFLIAVHYSVFGRIKNIIFMILGSLYGFAREKMRVNRC